MWSQGDANGSNIVGIVVFMLCRIFFPNPHLVRQNSGAHSETFSLGRKLCRTACMHVVLTFE